MEEDILDIVNVGDDAELDNPMSNPDTIEDEYMIMTGLKYSVEIEMYPKIIEKFEKEDGTPLYIEVEGVLARLGVVDICLGLLTNLNYINNDIKFQMRWADGETQDVDEDFLSSLL